MGSVYQGKVVGSFGDCAIFRFHPAGAIACSQGAVIVTDDIDLASRLRWYHAMEVDGAEFNALAERTMVLYQPWGAVESRQNVLVSDTDFVAVLTEIDIQTPVPPLVQERRRDRAFLFLGCRFTSQTERIFAHQISKRSSEAHCAVLAAEPTRNEARFLEQHGITRLELPLAAFADALQAQLAADHAEALSTAWHPHRTSARHPRRSTARALQKRSARRLHPVCRSHEGEGDGHLKVAQAARVRP